MTRRQQILDEAPARLARLQAGESVTMGKRLRTVRQLPSKVQGRRYYNCVGPDRNELRITFLDGDPENDAVRLELSIEGHDFGPKRDKSIYAADAGGPAQ